MTTSVERFWPESAVVEQYLAAAAADHPGHKALDLAVWYAIMQNYVNRAHIRFMGRPFLVHFFLVAYSKFGKSSSLKFGFQRFIGAYRKHMGQVADAYDPRFIDLSGQNTAPGLIDAFNETTDPHGYQVVTAWADETTNVFPKYFNRRDQDVASLLGNVLFGKRNMRYARERSSKTDSVDHPLVNACFPAAPDQYTGLMKNASSSDILKRFILLSPQGRDKERKATDITRFALNMDKPIEAFCQWLNTIELNAGIPNATRELDYDTMAIADLYARFESHVANAVSEEEQTFFAGKQGDIIATAALNALSRCSMRVERSDVEAAWNLLMFSWTGSTWLEENGFAPIEEGSLTSTKKERKAVIDRIVQVIAKSGRDGIIRKEIRKNTYALRYFSEKETEEMFEFVEKLPDIYALPVETKKSDGRKHIRTLYFAQSVWPIEEACKTLQIMKPMWSASANGWIDAGHNCQATLKECLGYRPEWETEVESPPETSTDRLN